MIADEVERKPAATRRRETEEEKKTKEAAKNLKTGDGTAAGSAADDSQKGRNKDLPL